jgi:hypothetical protein
MLNYQRVTHVLKGGRDWNRFSPIHQPSQISPRFSHFDSKVSQLLATPVFRFCLDAGAWGGAHGFRIQILVMNLGGKNAISLAKLIYNQL